MYLERQFTFSAVLSQQIYNTQPRKIYLAPYQPYPAVCKLWERNLFKKGQTAHVVPEKRLKRLSALKRVRRNSDLHRFL